MEILGLGAVQDVRLQLRAKSNKLWAEGNKVRAKNKKLSNKLWAEGDKLWAEGDNLWAEALLKVYNVKRSYEWRALPSELCCKGSLPKKKGE